MPRLNAVGSPAFPGLPGAPARQGRRSTASPSDAAAGRRRSARLPRRRPARRASDRGSRSRHGTLPHPCARPASAGRAVTAATISSSMPFPLLFAQPDVARPDQLAIGLALGSDVAAEGGAVHRHRREAGPDRGGVARIRAGGAAAAGSGPGRLSALSRACRQPADQPLRALAGTSSVTVRSARTMSRHCRRRQTVSRTASPSNTTLYWQTR